MAGPTKYMKEIWGKIRQGLKTDEPKVVDKYLGCTHVFKICRRF